MKVKIIFVAVLLPIKNGGRFGKNIEVWRTLCNRRISSQVFAQAQCQGGGAVI